MLTLVGIVAAVLGISLLIVVHEAGHFFVARFFGMRVERFSVGFGPVLAKVTRAGTEFAISAVPLGGYVKICGMAPGEDVDPKDPGIYANQKAWRRFLVILAGPAMNYLAAVVLGAALLLGPGLKTPDPGSAVGELVQGYPAEAAGLLPGDRVLAVAGEKVSTWEELVHALQSHPGEEIPLLVARVEGGKESRLTLAITPREEGGVGRAGFSQHAVFQTSESLAPALSLSFDRTNTLAVSQVTVFGKVFSGAKGTKVSGPIGIVQQLLHAAHEGAAAFASLLWAISVVLAVLNLYPLPALDGGRLVFLLYEVLTRRKVNAQVENFVHLAGFVVLFGLLIGVTLFGDLGLGGKISHLFGR